MAILSREGLFYYPPCHSSSAMFVQLVGRLGLPADEDRVWGWGGCVGARSIRGPPQVSNKK